MQGHSRFVLFFTLLVVSSTGALLAVDDVVPPGDVSNLTVDRSGADTVLAWDAVSTDLLGNPETLAGYRVFRGTTGDFLPDKFGGANRLADPPDTTFTDAASVSFPESYYYLVSAVDAAGNVGNPRPSAVNTSPVLSGSFSVTGASLDWTAASGDVGGYQVIWGTASGDYSNIRDVGNALDTSIFPLLAGIDYYFAVLAYDSQGNVGVVSNEFSGRLGATGSGTEVCGRIDTDTSWTMDKSPYIVTCTVDVYGDTGPFESSAPAVLTIEAGVVIKFADGTGLNIGNGANQGALVAQGSSAQPIIFTALDTFPGPGTWTGINFADGSLDAASAIEFAAVELAGTVSGAGITLTSASPILRDLSISGSAGHGLHLLGNSAPTLDRLIIQDVASNGIRIAAGSSPTIRDSMISGAGSYGLYFLGETSSLIEDNVIDHGVFVTSAVGDPVFNQNTFTRYGDLPSRVGADDVGEVLASTVFAGSDPSSSLDVLGERIAANATWSDPGFPLTLVSGTAHVYGGPAVATTLGIGPGVEIRFNSSTRLQVGSGSNLGALSAVGTASSPVVFTTNNSSPAPGQWQGIYFENATVDGSSRLDHCVVEYAGQSFLANVYLSAASPTISNCAIRHGSGYGIYGPTAPVSPLVAGSSFSNNGNFDVYISGASEAVLNGNTFTSAAYFTTAGSTYSVTGNVFDDYDDPSRAMRVGAHVVSDLSTNVFNGTGAGSRVDVLGETLSVDATWSNPGFPLVMLGNVIVARNPTEAATLTLSPGMQLRFNSTSTGIEAGTNADRGALVAVGTELEPIVFTTNNALPAAGQWRAIQFNDGAAGTPSILEHCVVEYGGSTYSSNVRVDNASPTIRNCAIRNSSAYGIYVTGTSTTTIEDSTISSTVNYGIYSTGDPVIRRNTVSSPGNYGIYIAGVSSAQIEDNNVENSIYFDNAGGDPVITGNNLTNYDPYPARFGARRVEQFLTQNTFPDATSAGRLEVLGDTLSEDTTWPNPGFHLRIVSSVIVANDAATPSTLTLGAGMEMRFNSTSVGLEIGTSTNKGALVAAGTPAAPIVFTTNNAAPAPGQWRGILFDDGSAGTPSILEHCVVEYGGSVYSSNVRVDGSSPTIRNCAIRESSVYGIYVTGVSNVLIEDSTILSTGNYGIYSTSDPVILRNTVSTPGNYGIYITGASSAQIQDNQVENSIYFNNATGDPTITGNTLANYDAFPARFGAGDVEEFLTQNTFPDATPAGRLEVIGETLSQDATWPNPGFPLLATSTIIVARDPAEAATLTLSPGIEMRFFSTSVALEAGTNVDKGALVAVGTPAEPIVFTSNNASPAPGQWRAILFNDGAAGTPSILEHCVVEYGGSFYSSNVRVDNSSPTIRNCQIDSSSVYGLYATGTSAVAVEGNSFATNGNFDMFVSGASDATVTGNTFTSAVHFSTAGDTYTVTNNTFEDYDDAARRIRVGAHAVGGMGTNTFNGTGPDSLVEILGETLGADATWSGLGFPYAVLGSITVARDAASHSTLTLEPGVNLRFNSSTGLFVGTTTARGALRAVGTPVDPVVFTTSNAVPAPAQWRAVYFAAMSVDETSLLENCVVEYGGQSYSSNIRLVGASPTIRNCAIRNGSLYGVYGTVSGDMSSPTIEGSTFTGQANLDVLLTGGSDAILIGNGFQQAARFDSASGRPTVSNNTFDSYIEPNLLRIPADSVDLLSGNVFNGTDATSAIEVIGERLAQDATWPNPGLPYDLITADLQIYGDLITPVTLTIDPGVVLRFGTNRGLVVGSGANLGALVAVGTPAEPVTFTADSATPAPGSWRSIYFDAGTVDETSILQDCVVEYGGQSYVANVRLIGASPTIRDCEIGNGSGYGIYGTVSGSDRSSPTVENTVFADNVNLDGLFVGGSDALFTGNTIDNGLRFDSALGDPVVESNTFNNYLAPNMLRIPAHSATLLSANTFNDTDASSVVELIGEVMDGVHQWADLAVPYALITTNLTVSGTLTEPARLTIDPGTTIRMQLGRQLIVGTTNTQGELIAVGTVVDPITFTSNETAPAAGDWLGLYFQDGTTLASALEHAIVEYAGRGWAGIWTNRADLDVTDVLIRDSDAYGLYATNSSPTLTRVVTENTGNSGMYFTRSTGDRTPIVTDCTVTNPTNYGIYNSGSSLNTRITGCTVDQGVYFSSAGGQPLVQNTVLNDYLDFPLQIGADSIGDLTGNTFNDLAADSTINIWGEAVPGTSTWQKLAIPYRVDSGFLNVIGSTTESAVLTLDPGVTIQFDPSSYLQVGDGSNLGTLVAIGTAAEPILFTTSDPVPAPGQWPAIYFQGSTVDEATILRHCVVEYGGQSGDASVVINASSPTIERCTIRNSNARGLHASSSNSRIRFNDIRDNASWGVRVFSAGNGFAVHHNDFSGNVEGAVQRWNGQTVDARFNWFGDVSGPGDQGPGAGQGVSVTVAFSPWLGSGFTEANLFTEMFASTPTFMPGSLSGFDGQLAQDSSWTLQLLDTGMVSVRTINGNGTTIDTTWDGTDDSLLALPDGPYRYRFDATGNTTSDVAAPLIGMVGLDATYARAEVDNPMHLQTFPIGTSIPVDGTADGVNFSSYTLQYGSGLFPTGYSTITSSSTPVTSATLGNWNTTFLTNGIYRLRLLVSNTLAEQTEVDLGTFILSVNTLGVDNMAFSPNADGVIDEVTATATLSTPADSWTLDVVDVATTNSIRTFAGSGTNVVQSWNGTLSDGMTVAPEGDYRFDLVATKDGQNVASSSADTALDLTPPVAQIAAPSDMGEVATTVDVIGDALDPAGRFSDYVLDYGLGATPLSYTNIMTGFTEVSADVLGSWITNDAGGGTELPNGGYQLRLRTMDNAGNSAVFQRQVSVDNLVLGNVAASTRVLDPGQGDSVVVDFSLNKPADVTLTIHEETPGEAGPVLRTLAGNFPPGDSSILWDGLDELGQPLPDEAYVFVLNADAGSGRTDKFAPPGGLSVGSGSGSIDPFYDPYINDSWQMTYNNSSASRVTMQVTPSGGSTFNVLELEPHEAGPFVIKWDGRDDAGQIVEVSSSIYFPPPTTLRPNYLILEGDTPRTDGTASDPYRLFMSYSHVSRLSFDLERESIVKVTLLPPGIVDAGDPSGVLLVDNETLPAGPFEVLWDPIDAADPDENTFYYSEEGPYTFVIETQNPNTGTTALSRGVVNMFR